MPGWETGHRVDHRISRRDVGVQLLRHRRRARRGRRRRRSGPAGGRAAAPDPRRQPAYAGRGLITHGHIDHIWSAQKVSDFYGIPTYIHPEDRVMLTDPIRGIGPQGRSARGGRAVSRAHAGHRTGAGRGQARTQRFHCCRRAHARAHPRLGGLRGAGRPVQRRLQRRHAVQTVGGSYRSAGGQWARPAALDPWKK